MGRDVQSPYSLTTRIMGSLWGILTIVVAGPIMLWGQLWWRRGRGTETGLDIVSVARGATARYTWGEITSMRMVGYGPMTVPELTLANGCTIMLKRDRWEDLAPVLSAHNIPVHNPWARTSDNDG